MKNSNKGIAPIIIILVVAGVLLLAGGGFYLYQNSKIKVQNERVLAPAQNQQANQPEQSVSGAATTSSTPKNLQLNQNSNYISPCEKIKEEGSRSNLKIIQPNGGEHLCIGKNYIIKWQAPLDLDMVTLQLERGFGDLEKIIGKGLVQMFDLLAYA